MSEPILAWHFVGDTLRDGRPIPADGELLTHPGWVVPCKRGLHASVNVGDALLYAPGTTLCRVRLSGTIKSHENDKHVADKRTILWRIDAREILLKFARQCALDVIHLWDAPMVVWEFLNTGDPALACAAADAACAAAHAAAYAAADAACAAAHAAAYAAAYAAARAAARQKQNERLTAMVMEYAGSLGYALGEAA